MDKNTAKIIIQETFQNPFDKTRFRNFVVNLLNHVDESKAFHARGHVKEMFKQQAGIIKTYERIGTYIDPEGKKIDILVVYLEKSGSIDRARTTLRNFAAHYLKQRDGKDAGLFAFVSPNSDDWRFSFVKMEYNLQEVNGKVRPKEEFTLAKRYSFLVGKNESSHTAQNQFVPLLEEDDHNPTLAELEDRFNIEVIAKEFFTKYRELFLDVKEALEKVVGEDLEIKEEFSAKFVDTADFSKKLLGQIVFLYFLQKKGWFGVEKGKDWGTGSKSFMRDLFEGKVISYKNFFNDILEPLFYDALALDRSHDDHWNDHFQSKIPFLNGGLFDPISGYNWHDTEILLPNYLFSNDYKTKQGDKGTGILDIFDRYNFTVKEDEPLEKEVAVDPEMLGKVFENLLEVKDRKSKGTYYTPREIVHYMCEQSLVNYLATELEGKVSKGDLEQLIKFGENVAENEATYIAKKEDDPDYEGLYKQVLPPSIGEHAKEIDEKLATIKVCDPAIGSGAFPVGMMSEIVKSRGVLSNYIKDQDRSIYSFKRDCVQNSLYGVDIDPGAVEIAKLRLWLSLIVDEEDIKDIKPLPNLDYKIMQGNSLLEDFEGVKLFDEKLLLSNTPIDEQVLEKLREKQSVFSKKILPFYSQNPAWKNNPKLERPLELFQMEKEFKQIQQQIKNYQATSISRNNSNQIQGNLNFEQQIKASQLGDKLKFLHKQFFEESNKSKKEELKKQISDLEWKLIETTLKEQGKISALKKLEEFKRSNTKPFFLWRLNFADVFEEKGGFDIVIGNPPYVEFKNLAKSDKINIEKIFTTSVGKYDLYIPFYEKSVYLLKDNGILSFINPTRYMHRDYGEKLRAFLLKNVSIKTIIDFCDYQVFDTALAYTGVFIYKKFLDKNNKILYKKVKTNLNESNLENSLITVDTNENVDIIHLEQSNLNEKPWYMSNNKDSSVLEKIKLNSIELIDICNGIYQGIATGKDSVFIVNDATINKFNLEGGILKPLLKGKDIYTYGTNWRNTYVIYPYNDEGKVFSEDYIKDKFSNCYKYLKDNKGELSGRDYFNKSNKSWFELWNQRNILKFKNKKIITLDNASKNSFTIDENGFLGSTTSYSILIKPETKISYEYLLSILNSKILNFFHKKNTVPQAGGFFRYQATFIKSLPIKKIAEGKQKPFIDLVDKILNITKTEDYLKNTEKQTEVKELEHQIDELVYKLYELTEEEIKIVEAK